MAGSSSSTLNVLIKADVSALQIGMNSASSAVKSFGAAVSTVAAPLIALAGVSFAGFGIFKAFSDISSIGSAAKLFGDSVENMSALAFAAGKVGISLEGLTDHAHHMTKELGDASRGGKEAQETFNKLNINFQKFGQLNFTDQLKTAADRISAMANPAERMSVAMQLFGKSGAELLPFLTKGSAGIEELMQKGRDSGAVFGSETVQGYKNFQKAIGNLGDIVGGVFTRIAVASTPVLESIADWVNGAIAYGQQLYTQFAPEIMQLKDVVVGAFTMLGEMALNIWSRMVDGGNKLLAWFGTDWDKTLVDWRAGFLIGLSSVEVYMQNWWEAMQRMWYKAELSIVSFVNDFAKEISRIGGVMQALQDITTRGIEGTMQDIKTILADSRPLSPLEEQLTNLINDIDNDFDNKIGDKIKERLAAFNVKANVAVAANKLPDVSGRGPGGGKAEPVAAVQQGSVEAMSAIFKARDAKTDLQITEAKRQTALLQQIANGMSNAGPVLKPLGL